MFTWILATFAFLVLDKMIAVADNLYTEVRERRMARKVEKAAVDQPLAKKMRPLKERDPW